MTIELKQSIEEKVKRYAGWLMPKGYRLAFTIVSDAVSQCNTAEAIKRAACEYFNHAPEDIFIRHYGTKKPDQYNMRMIRRYVTKAIHRNTDLKLDAIAEAVGVEDHTTILYDLRTLNNLISTDEKIKEVYRAFERYIEDVQF